MIIKYQNGFYHVPRCVRMQLRLRSSMLETDIPIITNNRNLTLTSTAERKSAPEPVNKRSRGTSATARAFQ